MPRNPDKVRCSVPDCRAWAMRGSDPPLCASHIPGRACPEPGRRACPEPGRRASPESGRRASPESGRGAGAPFGNRNAFSHGFYASTLHPDDLATLDEQATDHSLEGEILIIRIALRRLQHMILTGATPGPNPRRLEASDYARFIGLTFQGTNTLSRLLRVRFELPDNPWDKIMDLALDGLSEEWGIEL